MQKSFALTSSQAQADRGWHVVDISGMTLGRAATQIASLLRGKHKTKFTRYVDSGDFVVVLNSAKVKLTGNKGTGKLYYQHSLFPGGMTTYTADELREHNSNELVERAVWGMLPKGRLGRRIFK